MAKKKKGYKPKYKTQNSQKMTQEENLDDFGFGHKTPGAQSIRDLANGASLKLKMYGLCKTLSRE